MVKIMSFNLLCAGQGENAWQNRVGLVVNSIRKNEPDMFGLQEAHKEWMEEITAAFPDYSYIGVGREDGKDKGEFSPIFYRKDQFEVQKSETFWLSQTPKMPSKGWDAACDRICTYGIFLHKKSDITFVHYNTHLDHIGLTAQQEGAKLIIRMADENKQLPSIITGDFNVTPHSIPYNIITQNGFIDARDGSGETSYTFHAFDNPQENAAHSTIDYIFVNDKCKVKYFKVITDKEQGRYPSDHYPVMAELSLHS
ncbi:MAG: endonuclease/exonuclease/phosphatase family protein [Clostridiales bacterium]|nr:endonuclease/exonuclease/phosphatase family protein [Clostridiales bacterium]